MARRGQHASFMGGDRSGPGNDVEKISDAWSRVVVRVLEMALGKGEWKRYLIWLVIPLIGLTVWRLMTQKQWSRARQKASAKAGVLARLGLDSEFYLIERRLVVLWPGQARRRDAGGVARADST